MMQKRLIIIMAAVLVCLGMEASPKGSKPGYDLRKHEISFSIGAVPTRSVIDGFNYFMKADVHSYLISLTNTYFNASTYEIEKTTPFMSVNYMYNRSHRWAFGGSLSYENSSDAFFKNNDDSLVNMESKNIITAMAFARLTWLNRPFVRMYSMVGMGRSFSLEGELGDGDGFAMQVVPLGISAGRNLYGFAETGLGTSYFGINVGIGYRF